MADQAKDEWVRRVLGTDLSASGKSAPDQSTAPLDAKALSARLVRLRDDAVAAGTLDLVASDLRLVVSAIKSDAAEAADMIAALEQQVAALSGTDASQIAAVGARTGLKLKVKAVEGAREWAAATLEIACRSMLRTAAFEDDPDADSAELDAIIGAIGDRVPDFTPYGGTIAAALAELERAGANGARKQPLDRAKKAITAYRAAVDAEPLLREMEDSDAGSFGIHSAIVAALDDLQRDLA